MYQSTRLRVDSVHARPRWISGAIMINMVWAVIGDWNDICLPGCGISSATMPRVQRESTGISYARQRMGLQWVSLGFNTPGLYKYREPVWVSTQRWRFYHGKGINWNKVVYYVFGFSGCDNEKLEKLEQNRLSKSSWPPREKALPSVVLPILFPSRILIYTNGYMVDDPLSANPAWSP